MEIVEIKGSLKKLYVPRTRRCLMSSYLHAVFKNTAFTRCKQGTVLLTKQFAEMRPKTASLDSALTYHPNSAKICR